MNLNLKMTVERSKRRSQFLSLVFITKCFNKNLLLSLYSQLNASSISRVKQKLNKSLSLVNPDPGKIMFHTRKKAKCVLCCTEDVQNTSETQQPEETLHLLREIGAQRNQFSPRNFRS